LRNLPIRVRLTLVFACSMAGVLLATGALLYLRVGDSLAHTVDEGLEARSAEIATEVRAGLPVADSVLPDDQDEQFVQLLDQSGRVVDATPRVRGVPLLQPEDLARAASGERTAGNLDDVPGVDSSARFLARRVQSEAGPRVLVVGASLAEHEATITRLLAQLLVVGPVALILVSLLAYWLASAALNPVESMRAEAAAISAAEPGRRLTLPRPRDEVRRLGETLNETLGRLEAALSRERSFVADASHEMRSPVARLKAELDLTLRHPRTAEQLEDAVRSASAETDLLARLTDNLLLLARSDDAGLALHKSPVDVASLLQGAAARFRDEAAAAGRRVDVDAPEALEITADQAQLEQALANAVQNALRHGGGTVTLHAIERVGVVELHVLDEGGGFAPGFIPEAFSRFSRADEARTSPGTGLGLAIVRTIAAAHGGSAHVANRRQGGADMWLVIPVGSP
jgi:signal transduction histidine kinase